MGHALGIDDELHRDIIAALDRGEIGPTTELEVKTHFETVLKVDADAFTEAWNSPTVAEGFKGALRAYQHFFTTSAKRAGRYLVNPERLPPVFLINGEHIVASFNVKRQRHTFQLANEFIARELAPEPAQSAEDERWRALYEELRRVRPRDIAYTSPLTPEPGQIIEIDPPLRTAAGWTALEIEWFFAYMHRGHDPTRTTSWLTGRMEGLFNPWAETVPEDDFKRLRARFTVVSTIPGTWAPHPSMPACSRSSRSGGIQRHRQTGRAAGKPHLVPDLHGHPETLYVLHAPGNAR